MKKLDFENTTATPTGFKVPDGYFENLTAQVMANVADHKVAPGSAEPAESPTTVKVSFWQSELYAKIKPYVYIAAMVSSIYFGVWVYKYQQSLVADKEVATATAEANDADVQLLASDMTPQEREAYVDDACDYMMTDNNDLASYLTDESADD